jgi:cysteine sulfinate desulfinase/cysteine desulfurase-like protein
LPPFFIGGNQENARRAGTEACSQIVAFGACGSLVKIMPLPKMKELEKSFRKRNFEDFSIFSFKRQLGGKNVCRTPPTSLLGIEGEVNFGAFGRKRNLRFDRLGVQCGNARSLDRFARDERSLSPKRWAQFVFLSEDSTRRRKSISFSIFCRKSFVNCLKFHYEILSNKVFHLWKTLLQNFFSLLA